MKHYLSLLRKWWHAAAASPGLEGRRRVCEQLFQGGEDEFGVMEALKLLMLACAVELHAAMERGKDVPIFCWLLFSRYTSSCPRTFLANHLSQVGFSGGMEQVEMCLLGYTLHHTIKVYRLYMANMADFIITHYPDDHIQDWPSVCLVTEDGRHYNVAVGEPACPQEDLSRGPH
ncbi:ubiquitin thioesterase otulin-like [Alosa sapidissima]|nr:ubiquitin thioesterase otulin-like [Alosa sapidissima]